MLVEAIGLREIPHRTAGLVERSAANDRGASVRVAEFVGPLRDVTFHVQNAERACTLRECVDVGRRAHIPAAIGRRQRLRVPFISPRIKSRRVPLRGFLPLPIMRQTLSGPGGVGAGVFNRYPSDWLVAGARRKV